MVATDTNGGRECGMDGKQAETLLGTLLASCLGGAVHWMRHPRSGYTIVAFCVSVTTAAFVGMLAHFLLAFLGYGENLQFAVAGIAGYGGGTFLDAGIPMLIRYCYKRLDMEYPEPKRQTNDWEELHDEKE